MATTSATLEPDDDAPHHARTLVREFLARNAAADLAEAGELLTTELVSNVVRHAHSPMQVDVAWDDTTLRVEVRDGSSIIPALAELADADGGFGLRIIELLALDWGVRQLDHGKAVWFTITRSEAVPQPT
jgi:anti-sigma regulatory factor (Ser/Thr protein kinase)